MLVKTAGYNVTILLKKWGLSHGLCRKYIIEVILLVLFSPLVRAKQEEGVWPPPFMHS